MNLRIFEEIDIYGPVLRTHGLAKIDTGAFSSSIHRALAEALELQEVKGNKAHIFSNAMGKQERKLVSARIRLGGIEKQIIFSVSDRTTMTRMILIGRRDLLGFCIQVAPDEADPNNTLNIKKGDII